MINFSRNINRSFGHKILYFKKIRALKEFFSVSIQKWILLGDGVVINIITITIVITITIIIVCKWKTIEIIKASWYAITFENI